MKRTLLILLIGLLSLMNTNAQENTTEKVETKAMKQYLPEKGDWAVGVDVVPLLNYVSSIFNKKDKPLKHLSGTPFTKSGRLNELFEDTTKNFKTLMPDVSIMGKYFLTDKFALRANIGLKISSETERYYVDDDKASILNPLGEAKVVDKIRTNRNGVSILLGGEYRKGERRIQGVFGVGVLFAFMNDKVKYDYGNQMTNINQNPGVSDEAQLPEESEDQEQSISLRDGYRVLTSFNTGANFYTGITGSAGVEWFVAPKISLGAEVNLSLYYLCGSKTYVESEGYNTKLNRIEKRTDLKSPGNRGFYMATECLGGSLNLNFYF
ncbi:MAG: hypothetical protein K2I90_06780 [Odoribacter sp.]|nr:hypothetical protein [Odoribacter sp.]